jgi:hypothetical protein
MESVDNNKGKQIFVEDHGGTGKTFMEGHHNKNKITWKDSSYCGIMWHCCIIARRWMNNTFKILHSTK